MSTSADPAATSTSVSPAAASEGHPGPSEADEGAPRSRWSGPRWGPELLAAAGAVVVLVCAVLFPLAPVTQPVVTYAWPQAGSGTATALPLMPYQPVAFRASIGCDAVRATPPGTDVLATVPAGAFAAGGATDGLRARLEGGGPDQRLRVTSGGVELAAVPLPAGPCEVVVDSTPARTAVTLDGRPVATTTDDVRPVVAALLTGAPSPAGLAVTLQTDTRFQTTPSPVKWLLGAGVVVGALVMLVGLARADGPRPGSRRPPRRPGLRPRLVDAAVGAGLLVWAVVGPATVDDGYISGILRSRGENGFVGNVYRWLNAPEAPFSWFYEVDRAWDALSPGPASMLWMRIPATVLGLVCWLLVSRHALPRLGPVGARAATRWTAALVFAAWWLPFGLSLRPEPWVAVGSLAAWLLVERAVATGRSLPLGGAAVVGGLTVALTPGALIGVVPLLVGLPALLRARPRGSMVLRPVVRVLAVLAGLAVAVVPMTADQSLAAVLESTRVRQVIGGGQPWWAEIDRYRLLLYPDNVQGGLAARAPVLLLLLALPAVWWAVRVLRVRGVAPAPAARLLATTALGLVLLTFSPTKWTLHFGTFAGLGTAVLTLLVVCWTPRALRGAVRPPGYAGLGVLAGVLLVASLVLVGWNQWAYASDWGVFWSDIPPQVLRTPLDGIVLYAGLAAVLVLAVALAVRPGRWLAPAAAVVALLLFVTAVVGMSFVKVTVSRAGTFSYGESSLATLRGQSCGLAPLLSVETDPAAGLLPPAPVPGPVPDDQAAGTVVFAATSTAPGAAGRALPGWVAPGGEAASLTSPWFSLPASARDRSLPVVVAVAGTTGGSAQVGLEFASSPAGPVTREAPTGDTGGTAPRDLRALAPDGTTLVRVVSTSDARSAADAETADPTGGQADTPVSVSAPRVPVTVPFDDLVPPGSTALADWPVAFVFPCLRPPALTAGTAAIPPWRLVPPGNSGAGEIAVAPTTGGPFLTPRMLVDEVRYPVYLDGDPARDAVGLARWVPTRAYGALTPTIGSETVAGWTRDGRVTVPVLDTTPPS